MNPDTKLLIKNNVENIIKNIRNSSAEIKNTKLEISKSILADYHSLITNIISKRPLIIYVLHLISRGINNSLSLQEKELLLTLLPEFYKPFINEDISLTYPYLSHILTIIQNNILSEISPIFIGEIYKQIIIHIFNEADVVNREFINKDIFEIYQGFCLYNMKQKQFNHQLCGIICLNILLNEIDYSFLNNDIYMSYIWEKIDFFLSCNKFSPKEYLLKYLCDLITKFKIPFKPYVNLTIYKILGFIDNKNPNIRKNSLNVLNLLINFYPNEIKPIKSSITKLLLILQNDKDTIIREESINIYNKIDRQSSLLNKSLTKAKANNHNMKRHNLFYLDLKDINKYNNNNNNKILESKNDICHSHRIYNKRMVVRKPKNITCTNSRNNSLRRKIGIIDLSQNISINNNKNYNKKLIFKKKTNSSMNKYDNKRNRSIDSQIGFRDLLNIVKEKSDNKYNNNFSNLRDEIKKNNNALRQIRKIKSEKVLKNFLTVEKC